MGTILRSFSKSVLGVVLTVTLLVSFVLSIIIVPLVLNSTHNSRIREQEMHSCYKGDTLGCLEGIQNEEGKSGIIDNNFIATLQGAYQQATGKSLVPSK